MPDTPLGITYPASSGNCNLWEHFEALATDADTVIQALKDALEAPWTEYTPDWTTDLIDPTIGNGTLIGRYRKIGRTVDMVAQCVVGSTTNVGQGYYALSLPFAPRTTRPEQRLHCEVRGVHLGSPIPRWLGDIRLIDSAPQFNVHFDSNADGDGRLGRIGHDGPIPGGIAEGDEFTLWGTYEAAA